MWEFSGRPSEEVARAALSHLKGDCSFEFEGPYTLRADPVSFYPETSLYELILSPGTLLKNKRRRERIEKATTFYFLFRPVAGDRVLIPLTGGRGNIHVANRWLGLQLGNNEQRVDYVRFYYAYARTGKPPVFLNLPLTPSDLRFEETAAEQRRLIASGALWRFLDAQTRSTLQIIFDPRGAFWRKRDHAHAPVQIGRELFDADLNIWHQDGHITHTLAELIYRDDALAVEPTHDVGHVSLPRYITWRERLRSHLQTMQTALRQAAFLFATAAFFLASSICLLFPLEYAGISVVRSALELWSTLTDLGNWWIWLRIACMYCIGYFALTTFLALDVDVIRGALLAMSPGLAGGKIDEWLHKAGRKQYLTQRAIRLALWRRVILAATFLVTWSAYLAIVFTSLQASFRPYLATNPAELATVMTVFVEQAVLYVPVVVYYVGRQLLDPVKLSFVAYPILLVFRMTIGLLVVRRIHRFWASTARTKSRRR